MKQFLVKAYNGIGKDKVFAGEKWIDQAETLEEAKTVEGDEKGVIDLYFAAKVIEEQRKLRAKTSDSAKSQLNAILAVAKSDPKVVELLKAANIKIPWEKAEEKKEEVKGDEAKKEEATPPTPPANPALKEGETQVSPNVRRRRSK